MAGYTLKAFFNRDRIETISEQLAAAWPAFPRRRFVQRALAGLDDLELMARAEHIADAMAETLPADFGEAVKVVLGGLGPPRVTSERDGMAPFIYLPHCIYVARLGQGHFPESMHALRELTIRFSSEFPIRAFLANHPERTWKQLHAWCTDDNFHVRRLCSEGTRPRLPWASRVPGLVENPARGIALLEKLKDDPELYVRRSVANHLNDISYDHPELVVETCAKWMTGERAWLVDHALRTLVKKGHPGALAVLGFGSHAGVDVSGRVDRERVKIGESIQVELTVRNTSKRERRVVVDLGVHFVKARGGTSRKVFKGRDLRLAPGAEAVFRKSISFKQHSTRTHFAGKHAIDALLNGEAIRLTSVDVLSA